MLPRVQSGARGQASPAGESPRGGGSGNAEEPSLLRTWNLGAAVQGVTRPDTQARTPRDRRPPPAVPQDPQPLAPGQKQNGAFKGRSATFAPFPGAAVPPPPCPPLRPPRAGPQPAGHGASPAGLTARVLGAPRRPRRRGWARALRPAGVPARLGAASPAPER